MPSIPYKLTQSSLDLRASRDSGFIDTEGHASKFIQILDESMCVVREDIADWLQRYLFSSVNAPIIEPPFLLFRLRSGLWLSRLAYKLHLSVFNRSPSDSPHAATTTKSHEFLKGSPSHPSLRTLSRTTLPAFPRALIDCAKLSLGPGDVCSYPDTESPSDNTSLSSAQSSSSSPDHVPLHSRLSIADRWVARDNVSAFLQWCKELGIPQTMLFETTGLVHRTEEKNVLLTLMELARIAGRFGLDDLPELVRMEREIDLLEAQRAHASVLITKPSNIQSNNTNFPSETTKRTPSPGTASDSNAINVRIIRHRSPPANANLKVDQKPSATAPTSGDIVTTQTTVRIAGNYPSKQKSLTSTATIDFGSQSGANGAGDGVDFVMDSGGDAMNSTGKDIWCETSCDSSLSGSVSDSADVAAQTNNKKNGLDRGVDSRFDVGLGDKGQRSHATSTEQSNIVRVPPDPFVADQNESDDAIDTPTTIRLLGKRATRNIFNDELPFIQTPPFKVPKTISTISMYMDSLTETHSPILAPLAQAFRSTPCTVEDVPISPSTTELSPAKTTPVTVLRNLRINQNGSALDTNAESFSHNSLIVVQNSTGDSLCTTPILKPPRDDPCSITVDQTFNLNVVPAVTFRTDDSVVAEQVEKKVAQCTCCTRLHLQHLEEGRYRLGNRVYYFRRFRSHVMVRVGGGWLTLDAFLERHDPCRRGGNKAPTENTTDGSQLPPVSTAHLTVEPLVPQQKLSDTPLLKPPLSMSGSMVDLRRRWSKHSTSSNDSHDSHTSVQSATSARIERNRLASISSQSPRSNAAKKDLLSIAAGRPATPTSQNKGKTAPIARLSSVERKVTSSSNSRNRSTSRSTNPPRWR